MFQPFKFVKPQPYWIFYFCFGTLQFDKRGDKAGFMTGHSMGSGRIENSFSDLSIAAGASSFGSVSGFGLTPDVDSFSTKSKGSIILPLGHA